MTSDDVEPGAPRPPAGNHDQLQNRAPYASVIFAAQNPFTGRMVTLLPPFEFLTYAQRATLLHAFMRFCEQAQREGRDPLAANPYRLWGGLDDLEAL